MGNEMSKAQINIGLANGLSVGEGWLFRPGDVVKGSTSITALESMNCRSVYIVLQWRTRGRGSTHIQVVQRVDVHQGEIKTDWPLSFNFEFVLPNEPWSYTGHYINIVWELLVGIDLSWQSDPMQTATLIVLPERVVNSG
ncbi:MAG: hypothetical protein KA314_06680 [Chloroflexi bacterium]|nr:hypothetical protein [Chloroflexota bacterium]MBP8055510.1 hypothetical protein [Chloroflexota bacterium]